MAQWDPAKAKKLIAQAGSDKEASDAIYRSAMEMTFPDRENFTKRSEGQNKPGTVWDSSTTVSVIRAANRLSADFTPQFQGWFEIGLGSAAKMMPDEVFKQRTGRTKEQAKGELEALTKITQAVFNGPGFPTASNEMYIDWHYGQGSMKITPNDDHMGEPVIFSAMQLGSYYAYEGPNGKLDRWFFWHEVRADAIKEEWADAELPEDLQKKADADKPPQIKLVSVVYRDYGTKGKPYRYEVFWVQGSKSCDRIVERQSRSSPFVSPRYSKLAGENRGRGPVLFAMPDIRTVNKICELTLKAVSVAVAGVYTATEQGVLGPVNIRPYSVIKVQHNQGATNGPSLQRLDNPQEINFGQLVIDQLQMNIRKVIGDHSLPPEAGGIRTATEFIQRARELVADQAGGLGRLYAEFIIPAVQRVIDILEAKQILPTDGLQIDQFLVEVRMTSPLAKGEAMAEVENIVRFLELIKTLGGEQMAAFEVNLERTLPHIADLMSFPMQLRNTAEEKAVIKDSVVKAAAAAQGADPAVASAALKNAEAGMQNV